MEVYGVPLQLTCASREDLMSGRKGCLIVAISLLFIVPSILAGKSTPSKVSDNPAVQWVMVDQADWGVYMDAPAYHFSLAKQYLLKGNNAKASAELSRGKVFLIYQKKRLSASLREIDALLKKMEEGAIKDTVQFDAVTSHALNVINKKYTMIPTEVEGMAISNDLDTYHFDRAKEKLKADERAVTADEIRKASVFLRLKAAGMGITPWSKVDSAGAALQRLARKVESGEVKNVKDLDEVFQQATSIFEKKKE